MCIRDRYYSISPKQGIQTISPFLTQDLCSETSSPHCVHLTDLKILAFFGCSNSTCLISNIFWYGISSISSETSSIIFSKSAFSSSVAIPEFTCARSLPNLGAIVSTLNEFFNDTLTASLVTLLINV